MIKRFLDTSLLSFIVLVHASFANPLTHPMQSNTNTQSHDPFTMRVDVDLTTIEFVARDKDGQPIPNLKMENFQLYEDGKKQKILSFDEVKEESHRKTRSPSIIEDDRHPGKTVLILFMGGAARPDILQNMRDSAAKFVREHMGPYDMFALASGTSIRILQNFTTDRDEMLAAVKGYSFKLGQGATYEDMLKILERLSYSLSHIKGQKSILIYGTGYFPSSPSMQSALAKALTSARKSDVVFYTVDPSSINLSVVDSGATNSTISRSAASYPTTDMSGISNSPIASSMGAMMSIFSDLAVGTGGYAIRAMGDINPELDKLGRQLGNYYILGFQSNSSNHDGTFRKVEIKTDEGSHGEAPARISGPKSNRCPGKFKAGKKTAGCLGYSGISQSVTDRFPSNVFL
jgi:VWFA-related protein